MAEKARELGDFKGWVTLRLNFRLKGCFPPISMDCQIEEWLYYNFAAGRFHIKKLCSRLYLTKVELYSKNNQKIDFLSHPLRT